MAGRHRTHRLAWISGAGVLAAVIAVVAVFADRYQGQEEKPAPAPTEASQTQPESAMSVVLATAESRTFEDRLEVAGSVLAERFALVSARIPGTLDDIFVDEGDYVEAGKTVLFQTDSVKLKNAVEIAKEQVRVAECAVAEKQALLEKTQIALSQAKTDLERYRDLNERNAIARQAVEHQQLQVESLEAEVRHIRTLIDLAKAQLEQAKLNLRIAEKDLADSAVKAPVSGRVSQRMKEPGEMAGAGTPVVRIDDLSRLEVSVFVPAEYYERIRPGKTIMRVRVGTVDLGEVPVTYKSPVVEPKLRTFQVKALIESPPPEVVPGCLADVTLVFDARQGVGVPSKAVLDRLGRSVVFTVVDGRAKMVPVSVGWEQDGFREVLSGIAAGQPVVVMGQSMLDDGDPVRVVDNQEGDQ